MFGLHILGGIWSMFELDWKNNEYLNLKLKGRFIEVNTALAANFVSSSIVVRCDVCFIFAHHP